MKLLGSKTEQDFREVLIKSHKAIFEKGQYPRLLNILRSQLPELKTAYVIGHTPEQGEDIFLILVNANIIAKIELNRYDLNAEVIFKTVPIENFVKGLSKIRQIELAVAVELSNNDLQSNN